MSKVNVPFVLTGGDQFSSWVQLYRGQTLQFDWVGVVSGTQVTIQHRYEEGGPIYDLASYALDNSGNYEAHAKVEVRIGILSGQYSSGTVSGEMRR